MSSSGAPPPPTPPSGGRRQGGPPQVSPQIFSPRRTRDGLVRDGTTVQTPVTSETLGRELQADPEYEQTYVVRDIIRQLWVETTLQEARDYADIGYAVYDTYNHHRVEWVQPLPSEGKGHEGAFEGQFRAVKKADDALWEAEMNPPDSPSAGRGGKGKRDGSGGGGSPPAGGAGTGTGSGSNVVST